MLDPFTVYVEGQGLRVSAEFRADRALTDPSAVRFKLKKPSDDDTEVFTYGTDDEIVRESTGKYYVDLTLDESGSWHYRWESDGVVTAGQNRFRVSAADP